MIPRRIYTVWIGGEAPELVKKCIGSQKQMAFEHGYVHEVIENEAAAEIAESSPFLRDALKAKRWAKASDYIRMYMLYHHGGIHLDADMEVLPGKNFDDLLDNRMFTAMEVEGMFANAGVGAEPGHPILKEYLRRLDENFRGDGDLTFEPGIRAFCDLLWIANLEEQGIKIYPTKMFYPWDHVRKTMDITPETKVIHHYMRSWVK